MEKVNDNFTNCINVNKLETLEDRVRVSGTGLLRFVGYL